MGGKEMMMHGWPMASGMWLLMLFFWILVIVGIIMVIRRFSVPPREGPASKGDTPMEILRRRYAAGEIDREQFEEMKRDLEN